MFQPDFVFSTLLDLGILALFGSPNAEVDLDLAGADPGYEKRGGVCVGQATKAGGLGAA